MTKEELKQSDVFKKWIPNENNVTNIHSIAEDTIIVIERAGLGKFNITRFWESIFQYSNQTIFSIQAFCDHKNISSEEVFSCLLDDYFNF